MAHKSSGHNHLVLGYFIYRSDFLAEKSNGGGILKSLDCITLSWCNIQYTHILLRNIWNSKYCVSVDYSLCFWLSLWKDSILSIIAIRCKALNTGILFEHLGNWNWKCCFCTSYSKSIKIIQYCGYGNHYVYEFVTVMDGRSFITISSHIS